MRPIVKVLTPGAPDIGWGVSELEPGRFGLKGVAGSRENPIPVQRVNAVAFLIGDPANPQWAPGSHELTSAQTRVSTIPQDLGYSGTFVANSDTSTPSISPLNWEKWPLNSPRRIQARVSVGTDQSGYAEPFDESKSLIVEVWFARTGEAEEPRTEKIRFKDGDRLVTKGQFDRAKAAGQLTNATWYRPAVYAGTFGEFEALFPPSTPQTPEPPSVPAPNPEPVPVPTPAPDPQPPAADRTWIQEAVREVEAAELELAKAKERLGKLKVSLKGKL